MTYTDCSLYQGAQLKRQRENNGQLQSAYQTVFPPDFACPEGVVHKVPFGLMVQDTHGAPAGQLGTAGRQGLDSIHLFSPST